MNQLERIGVTEILGKEIEFYGNWEEPYFLGTRVAEWIDYQKVSGKDSYNVSKMLSTVDDDEKIKGVINMDTTSSDMLNMDTTSKARNTQEVWLLTEDGLYEVLMQSRKPIAKELKKKIKQHLKQIRTTGGTVENGREEEFINKYFPSFSEEVKLSMVQDLLKTNKELKPKADYCDNVLNASYNKTVTDIAKDLSMTAQKLNKMLEEKGIIYPKKVTKDGKTKIKGWYLRSEYDHLVPEYADYKITQYGQSLVWSEKGRKFIIELLHSEK